MGRREESVDPKGRDSRPGAGFSGSLLSGVSLKMFLASGPKALVERPVCCQFCAGEKSTA